MADRWYFAYGSNLSVVQKEKRTGRIRQSVRCFLPDYCFSFNKRAANGRDVYANIMPEPGSVVWGVAYLCNPAAMEKMDEWEGVAGGHYERSTVDVVNDANERFEAVTYSASGEYVCPEGSPNNAYLERIVTGARHHQLPEDYIRQIEQLAGKSA